MSKNIAKSVKKILDKISVKFIEIQKDEMGGIFKIMFLGKYFSKSSINYEYNLANLV